MAHRIEASDYSILVSDKSVLTEFSVFLETNYSTSKKVIIADTNTLEHCLPFLVKEVPSLSDVEVIEIEPGEGSKDLSICASIWETLTELNFSRNDLIINLGGGVVTDLGGFVASVYKRGVDFVQLPTSLLAQVDASVGGKTGIDFLGYKNQLGAFQNPVAVFINIDFLRTLEKRQLVSGMAEVFKHGLIADKAYFEAVNATLSNVDFETIVATSIRIKNDIVQADPFEKGNRKLLNFGHTVGHAIETHYLETQEELIHGEAIAIGMLIEAELSVIKGILPDTELAEVYAVFQPFFPLKNIAEAQWEPIIKLTHQDKKNHGEGINCTLITSLGKGVINQFTTATELTTAFQNYHNRITL